MKSPVKGAGTISLIATLCGVAVSALLLRRVFQVPATTDFSDLFLLCVLGVAYRHTWKLASLLAAATLALLAYALSPLDWTDGFLLISYTVCVALFVWIMASLRRPLRRAS